MIAIQQCVSNSFPLPHEVFELGLSRGALLVYIYLVYHKSLRRKCDDLSCTVISQVAGLCEKTVRTHLHTLVSEKLIQMSSISKSVFTYTLCLIQDKVEKCRAANSVSVQKASWWSTKQMWLTGEKFNAVFSLPNEVFRLGLKSGELLVYIYLQYQKGAVSGQCHPSYATIGAAVGMSRKTVQKHVCALVDKGLIATENVYEQKSESRDQLVAEARRTMLELADEMKQGICEHPEAEQLMLTLANVIKLSTAEKRERNYGTPKGEAGNCKGEK